MDNRDDKIRKTRGEQRQSRDAGSKSPRQDEPLQGQQSAGRTLRDEFVQEALPTPPVIEGWHLCWLSTTNSYDPIHRRQRIGYEPVKASEIPEFKNYHVKSAEFGGELVQCNEMILFKIPQERYQQIMAELHHHAPAEEEQRISERVKALVDGAKDSDGKKLGATEGDGFDELGKDRAVPIFQ